MIKLPGNIFGSCCAWFLFVFVFGAIFSQPVFANNALSLSISNNSIVLDLSPSSASGSFFKSSNINISVAVSGTGGYTLGIVAGTTGANSSRLVHTTNSNQYFSSISSAISESDFSNPSNTSYNNMWGYLPSKFHSSVNTSFRPAPNGNGDILDYTTVDNASGSYTMALGARANTSTATGKYTGTYVITAVANQACNPLATTIDEALCMQDMNDNVINSMETHAQYRLKDNRDWKSYYVAKMNDGRVWMTQNLDLDLETTPTDVAALTSENTDLNTFGSQNYTTEYGYSCSNPSTSTNCTANGETITWTPANATLSKTEYRSWSNEYYYPRSFDRGSEYKFTDENGGRQYFGSLSACEAVLTDGTCPHYHYGNYYNFTAAIASNYSSTGSGLVFMGNSICPAGWKLPKGQQDGSTSTDANYFYETNHTLLSEGIIDGYNNSGTGYYVSGGWLAAQGAPLFIVATGAMSGNTLPSSSSDFVIWPSNGSRNTYAQVTRFYNGSYINFSIGVVAGRYDGDPIRCVADQPNTGSTTITFNKNASSATGTMSVQTVPADTFSSLTANSFTRTGYAFNSWNTKPDGSGVSYADLGRYYASVGSVSRSVTLYAQWDKTYNITFNLSNAESVFFDGATYTNGQSVDVVENRTIVMGGNYAGRYGFNSWSATAGVLENSSAAATHYTVTANATITLTGRLATVDMTTMTNPSTPVSSTCKNDAVNPELVYDPRDDETYLVARLCDGKYWMLDNLRLDLTDSTIKNNLSSSNTNASEQVISCLTTGKYNGASCAAPYSDFTLLPATTLRDLSTYYTSGYIVVGHKNEVAPVINGLGSGKIGFYYNYCAASAGSYCYNGSSGVDLPDTYYDVEFDLCPKGWHLPTDGTTTNATEFGALYQSYNGATIGQVSAFENALSMPLSGRYTSSSVASLGYYGYLWTSTMYSAKNSYLIEFAPSAVGMGSSSYSFARYGAHSVRCVLGNP